MTILVYSGSILVERVVCKTEEQLEKLIDYWHDQMGYKIRVCD